MELQIKDLVTSIRKEGIDAANEEAAAILAQAKEKAAAIIAEAKSQAEAEKLNSEKEINVLKESAAVSAEQAKRDAMLAFKTEVQKEFERILERDINKELTGEGLGKLIKAVVAGEDASQYAAEVAQVSEGLKDQLAQEIKAGLEIRPTRGVNAGFRLAAKDGSGYFDCTDQAIAEMMMPYFRNLEI